MPNRPAPSRNELQEQLEMYQLIFDSIYNGVLVTDANGYITHFNKPYGRFLGLDPQTEIGKHCTESVENSRMHIVAKTGIPEINQPHSIKGQNMIVQRIPIKKDGKVIAVFGQVMFKDIKDVRKLANKLSLLESKVKIYEEELINLRATRYTFDSIIGISRTLNDAKVEALKATANQFPVLISGESGTGKEIFAQAIHHASGRRVYPFVRINCAAIPKDLLESELFGYEEGAFTDARAGGKPGKLELAHRGTLFLDEIGDLPITMQPKLLRVLEEKEFERVGGTTVIRSDFRLIAATNQGLNEMMADGRFRKDLFYRLNVIPLNISPLRERREDIVPIARHLLQQLIDEAALSPMNIDPAAEAVLKNYDWPGNVRELLNVLERTLSVLEGRNIGRNDLPFYLLKDRGKPLQSTVTTLKKAQEASEKATILKALEQSEYRKVLAADLLGIHRTLLYKKMKKYQLPLSAQ